MSSIQWKDELKDILPVVREIRRKLHRNPELSEREARTQQFIIQELSHLGIETSTFQDCYAVMGMLHNGEGKCIAIRADMDALPIDEETHLPFASEIPGVMHACGHDIHMALALGSAIWLSRHKDKWHGTVKWLFEPAEETVGGGQWMVAQGCMEHPDVDCVIGQHVNPQYPVGTFICKPGYVSGSSDELILTVCGQSCHGAYPERGTDAILIAAHIITAFQSLISRRISPFQPAVITIGTVHGGKANNIVCGEVKLTGTLRTLDDHVRKQLHQELISVAKGISEAMGGSCDFQIRPSYGAVYNHEHYYSLIEQNARQLLGEKGVILRGAPSLGVESFCYFVQHTPGVYYDLGSGIGSALHTSTFLADESILLPGIALQCENVLSVLEDS